VNAPTFLSSVEYYDKNQPLLRSILDQLVVEAKAAPGDFPAYTFSTLVTVLAKDFDKAVTVGALALMRLAAIEAVEITQDMLDILADEVAAVPAADRKRAARLLFEAAGLPVAGGAA
jgi:hypothetical protein